MAVEASRSTASADSYIGSLISLISKSEIRYEGILFNLNPEESSIGLRNVRSFGTEGRRKDGTHVSPIDKVYEYVVFRGTDIKDLQVKSSQPVQFPPHVPNDPAIIQSQYLQVSATSTSSSSATYGPATDLSTQMAEPDLWRSPFQGSLPLYQPGGSLGSWGSSTQPPSNGSGLVMPMYCQGFHRPSRSSLQTQEKTLLQPPSHGLPMPPSLQQSISCPMNVALPAGASNSSATQSSEFSPLLLPPIGISSLNLQSTIPVQSSALALELPLNSIPTRASAQIPSTVSQSFSLSLISPMAAAMDKIAISYSVPDQAKHASSPMMPYNGVREPLSAAVGTSTSPSLVTPGHFLQPGTTSLLSSQSSQMMQKDVEVVLASASVSVTSLPLSTESVIATASASASAEVQAPPLPLHSPSNPELDGVPLHSRYINTGGREIRGNETSESAINFTEDFDFEAMNEKFKKDEVWGHLSKSKAKYNDGEYFQDEDDIEFPEVKIKPVYKKDDFFDSLSCNFLGNGSRNGRFRFSEQMRIDTETFGDLSSHRGGRGGRGPGRGGRSRGGFYGRGYGYGYCHSYVGRGRGHTVYRAT
ncbi:hypothetical protein Nepgr_029026 [Nepenthes gracilis]|uniref:Protein decapping 5-like n=1 Tax=Nepenthes gracilis TaxID=150966 RepID=A0AAD3TBS5_NEPGR|nr:hypothetical protein Nepgr_029026 [Nepenthes gracilis]